MSDQPLTQEERIQSLANILSLVAIIGGMDKAAVQRVLITLGSNLIASPDEEPINQDITAQLLAEIAREEGKETALRIASDMDFVARAWQPVMEEYFSDDPYRTVPYAEVIFSLFNYSAFTLHDYGAFERFGGPDQVLPMPQLTAALKSYGMPRSGLAWEIVGFDDPPDQALVGSDRDTMYLFKAAVSNIDLRFSELARDSDSGPRQEHDVRVDDGLFAAFVAGLLGDMLYWAARLRTDALTGRQTWRHIKALINPEEMPRVSAMPGPIPATREPEPAADDDPRDEAPDEMPEEVEESNGMPSALEEDEEDEAPTAGSYDESSVFDGEPAGPSAAESSRPQSERSPSTDSD